MVQLIAQIKNFAIDSNIVLEKTLSNAITFLFQPNVAVFIFIKVLFILLTLVLLGFVIYFLAITSWLRFFILQDLVEFLSYKPYGTKRMTKAWRKILARLEKADESEYKLAVIEADEILDNVLKRLGYGGNNLKERLDNVTEILMPSLEKVKQVHSVRDSIVYDPDYRLTLDQARKLIEVYEQALKELEVLE